METLGTVITYIIAISGGFLAALWVASIFWGYQDISDRTLDLYARLFAVTLITLLGPIGVVLYLVLRPKRTLDEAYEHSLTEEALLRDIQEAEYCPKCKHRVASDFVMCPNCHSNIRRQCPNCSRVVEVFWERCPYCTEALRRPDS